MAYKSWNPKDDKDIYDRSLYDVDSKKWIREVKFPQKVIPSSQEAFEIFRDDHLYVNEDIDTRFVEVAITHKSPNVAKNWLSILVSEINNQLRSNEKKIASSSVEYIQYEISQTKYSELKMAFAQLAQNEMQKLMLIESRDDYVYNILEKPYAPELKFSPNRALICVLGFLLGFSLSIFFLLIQYFFVNKNN